MYSDFHFNISANKLLDTRICDLPINIKENSDIVYAIKVMQNELQARGLKFFNPKYYLGDEWFSPSESISISIPFYLCHPRLQRLEREMIGYAEGEGQDAFMKLLRHEAGHCFDYAYQLSKTKEWRNIFGNPESAYEVDKYSFDKNSRDFVINLEDYYAQSHPEEDFAETFAVWLKFERKYWEKEYATWLGALNKLRYIEKKANEIRMIAPLANATSQLASAKRLRINLRTYYNRKRNNLL